MAHYQMPRQKIKIYITPGCQACETTMQWFDQRNIVYERIVVYPNTEEETFLRKNVGHMFVPIVVIDGKILDPTKTWFVQLAKELL